MSTPAFRLRLPCIPFVPAIEGSLISSCSVHPPPGPCFIPPVPPPPPPSFGCYAIEVEATTIASGSKLQLEATVDYPNQSETGLCQPIIKLKLKVPKAGDRGQQGGSSSSSGSGTNERTEFAVLVDVTCNDYDCTIQKYYKNLEYDNETNTVYWVNSGVAVV